MIIATTNNIEGKKVKEYRGVVFGEVVNGVDFLKDFAAGITNILGGRSREYEKELIDARADAITEMIERAETIGANAILGVKIDYETLGQNSSNMLIVIASGTAVVLE